MPVTARLPAVSFGASFSFNNKFQVKRAKEPNEVGFHFHKDDCFNVYDHFHDAVLSALSRMQVVDVSGITLQLTKPSIKNQCKIVHLFIYGAFL